MPHVEALRQAHGRVLADGGYRGISAAIDTVGGDVLQGPIARVSYGGAISACGLVGGANLDTTVVDVRD